MTVCGGDMTGVGMSVCRDTTSVVVCEGDMTAVCVCVET